MKIRPLGDHILVKRIEEEEKTKGGIIIPDTAKEKPQEGRVIAVGNGKVLENGKLVPLEVTTGDRILFSKYSGSDIKLGGRGAPDRPGERHPGRDRRVRIAGFHRFIKGA